MATNTPNLNLILPTVGADDDNWGGFLNQNWRDTDGHLVARMRRNMRTFDDQPDAFTGLVAIQRSGTDQMIQLKNVTASNTLFPVIRADQAGYLGFGHGQDPTSNDARIEPKGAQMLSDVAVVTREKADGRYLRLSGENGPITGPITFNDNVGIGKALTVGAKLTVTGDAEIGQAVTVGKGVTVTGQVTVGKTLVVTEKLTARDDMAVQKDLTVLQGASIGAALQVDAGATVGEGLAVTDAITAGGNVAGNNFDTANNFRANGGVDTGIIWKDEASEVPGNVQRIARQDNSTIKVIPDRADADVGYMFYGGRGGVDEAPTATTILSRRMADARFWKRDSADARFWLRTERVANAEQANSAVRALTCGLADDSTLFGGQAADKYLRSDINQTMTQSLTVEKSIFVGRQTGAGSQIQFWDPTGNAYRSLIWSNTNNEFRLETKDNLFFKIWHAGNLKSELVCKDQDRRWVDVVADQILPGADDEVITGLDFAADGKVSRVRFAKLGINLAL